jgi:hypothetical protein
VKALVALVALAAISMRRRAVLLDGGAYSEARGLVGLVAPRSNQGLVLLSSIRSCSGRIKAGSGLRSSSPLPPPPHDSSSNFKFFLPCQSGFWRRQSAWL